MADAGQVAQGPRYKLALSRPQRLVVVLVVVALLGASIGGGVYWRSLSTSTADYGQAREELARQLAAARSEGFSEDDLSSAIQTLNSAPSAPADGPLARVSMAWTTQKLRAATDALPDSKARAVQRYWTEADEAISAFASAVDRSERAGAPPEEVGALREALKQLTASRPAVNAPRPLIKLKADAQALGGQARQLAEGVEAERGDIEAAAADIRARHPGDLAGMRNEVSPIVAQAHNAATVASLLKEPGIDHLNAALDRYAGQLGSGDINTVSLASGAAVYYGKRIHEGLFHGMPRKTIVLTVAGQHLTAFEGGKPVNDTEVTTGTPPNLSTDIGAMKVLRKSSPWKMHSPWPKGSPYWYPDATVQMALWFTDTGEALHDAYWQPCCWGPGSQYSGYASHGCVHVPVPDESFLYNWAEVDTPVIVYPGDGGSVASQLNQVSVDANGHPLTGPKGA